MTTKATNTAGKKTGKAMTEDQMVGLVRNALLVAGQEMGAEGDHWPVIKSTIHSITKDWEDLKVERNVDAELKTHLATWLKDLETEVARSGKEDKARMEKGLLELKQLFDAHFQPIDTVSLHVSNEDLPDHIKRAKVIIDTLEDDHA